MAAHGAFSSGFDSGFNITAAFVQLGGSLTFTSARGLSVGKVVRGRITFESSKGVDLAVGLGGSLYFRGLTQALNPNWLLIPDYVNWCGVWSAVTTYGVNDGVLYIDGTIYHAFVSKAASNLNHSPNDVVWWYRLTQDPWRKV